MMTEAVETVVTRHVVVWRGLGHRARREPAHTKARGAVRAADGRPRPGPGRGLADRGGPGVSPDVRWRDHGRERAATGRRAQDLNLWIGFCTSQSEPARRAPAIGRASAAGMGGHTAPGILAGPAIDVGRGRYCRSAAWVERPMDPSGPTGQNHQWRCVSPHTHHQRHDASGRSTPAAPARAREPLCPRAPVHLVALTRSRGGLLSVRSGPRVASSHSEASFSAAPLCHSDSLREKRLMKVLLRFREGNSDEESCA